MGALLLLFLAGALLCNAIPHLAAGTRGEAFPTPFARPRGRGLSPPITNVLWGSANLFAAVAILISLPSRADSASSWIALALGFLVVGCLSAWHFGAVRLGREK